MLETEIIDTNVVLVANGQHPDVSPGCIAESALRLQKIMQKGRFAVDDAFRILSEYQNKTQPKTGNRPGDAFVKWTLRNNFNTQRCDQISIRDHPERGFESFPDDQDLRQFDPSDRKFVAVAVAHPNHPPIIQAADSKWITWAPILKRYGIEVEFICEDDIKRFHMKKGGV
jgi:hypothetical protein